jgi:hypothetical protein
MRGAGAGPELGQACASRITCLERAICRTCVASMGSCVLEVHGLASQIAESIGPQEVGRWAAAARRQSRAYRTGVASLSSSVLEGPVQAGRVAKAIGPQEVGR